MKKVVCDRCGAELLRSDPEPSIVVYKKQTLNSCDITYDLCVSCRKKLKDWIAGKDAEITGTTGGREWVPISRQKPRDGYYIVQCNQWGGNMNRLASYYASEGKWYERENDITEYVSHWMELPDPPRERL